MKKFPSRILRVLSPHHLDQLMAEGNGMVTDGQTDVGGDTYHTAFIVEAVGEADLTQSLHGVDPVDRTEEGEQMLVTAGVIVVDVQADQAGTDLAKLLRLTKTRRVGVPEVPANAVTEVVG